jgi:4-azaleucine resistance transporter AzlC
MMTQSTYSELKAGMLAMFPVAAAAIPFAMVMGSEAIRQGLTIYEIVFMSLTVFAGSSQFIAVSLWEHPAPWASLALAVFLVNLRHTLMAASLAPKMKQFRPRLKPLAIFFMADETWALNEQRATSSPLTPAYYFGVALCLYILWAIGTALGASMGSLIPDPKLFGFDFVFPAVFICLVIGFAKSWHAAPVIIASAAASLLAKNYLGGTSFIIFGGLAGMTIAALLPQSASEVDHAR